MNRTTQILDVSAQCARLGYGEFEGVTLLQEHGIAVRQQDGLRIGFIVADNTGYTFNLPPLLVEDVTEMSRAVNAVALEPGQIARTLQALRPTIPANGVATTASPGADMGRLPIASAHIDKLQRELAANPAQKFDLARKVNVFNAQVEFVEVSLTGTHVGRHTAQLPRDHVFATRDVETQKRVKASFRIVDGDSALGREAQGIAKRVNALRSLYLRSVGSLGSVMLRSKHELFVHVRSESGRTAENASRGGLTKRK